MAAGATEVAALAGVSIALGGVGMVLRYVKRDNGVLVEAIKNLTSAIGRMERTNLATMYQYRSLESGVQAQLRMSATHHVQVYTPNEGAITAAGGPIEAFVKAKTDVEAVLKQYETDLQDNAAEFRAQVRELRGSP